MSEKLKPGGWSPQDKEAYRPKPERNRAIRELYKNGEGVTQAELAKMFGIKRQRVHQILKAGGGY